MMIVSLIGTSLSIPNILNFINLIKSNDNNNKLLSRSKKAKHAIKEMDKTSSTFKPSHQLTLKKGNYQTILGLFLFSWDQSIWDVIESDQWLELRIKQLK